MRIIFSYFCLFPNVLWLLQFPIISFLVKWAMEQKQNEQTLEENIKNDLLIANMQRLIELKK